MDCACAINWNAHVHNHRRQAVRARTRHGHQDLQVAAGAKETVRSRSCERFTFVISYFSATKAGLSPVGGNA